MKFIAAIIFVIFSYCIIRFAFKNVYKFPEGQQEVNPNIFDKGKDMVEDRATKEIAKNKARQVINEKFNLGGKHDEQINNYTEKVIDKIGTKNILKAKNIFEKIKK